MPGKRNSAVQAINGLRRWPKSTLAIQSFTDG
jgi:hypothetical protein